MMDLNTPIFRSRGAVNDTGEHLGSKIQTWMILWRPIKPILDGRRETEDGVWFWTNLTQQGVILLDQDRLYFAVSAKDLASGPAKERAWWFRMCPKEAHRARFGNAEWEQHFEIWSVDSEQDSIECWRNGEFGDGSIGSREFLGTGNVSIKKEKKRANVATIRKTKSIVAFCTTILFKSQDWYSSGHGSHTPLPDEGNKPMMDLAHSLQTMGVHALADMQKWYVRTQTWYEHVAASICADEEVLTVAQRPSWYSDTYPGTETDSCQWSRTSIRMLKLSETNERCTSLRHFSRWTDHDSNEQSKSNEQRKSTAKQQAIRKFVNWLTPNRELAQNF